MMSSQSIYTIVITFVLSLYSCSTAVTAFRAAVGNSIHVQVLVPFQLVTTIQQLRGGDSSSNDDNNNDEYTVQLDTIKSKIMIKAGNDIETLRTQIEDDGKIIIDLGAKSDAIVQGAINDFISLVQPPNSNNPIQVSQYELKLQEINTLIDTPLHVLYLQQLCILRTNALQQYRISSQSNPTTSDYESMISIDTKFVNDAMLSSRANWDYTKERLFLQSIMNHIAESNKRSIDVQITSSQQQQTAMSFLQSQQQMIQQLQMQLYGQTSPWNVGVAYRIPDTNFNINGSYQQGRANIQLSCVPDEYAPMLGPNGFTNGVGPGNLGLSLNLSI